MHGIASLSFAGGPAGADATRLIDLEQQAPLRVLFPREPGCGTRQAVLATTSGGMVGGDVCDIAVTVGEGAAVVITTQAAEKVYRSTGADTRISVDLRVAAGGWLEWMPQETILFDGSRLDRLTTVDLATGARFLGAESVVFGRTAHGEGLTRGLLRDAWRIRVGGRLVWSDTLLLEGDVAAILGARAAFAGAIAAAVLVYAADDAVTRLDLARAVLEGMDRNPGVSDSRFAATCVNRLLVVRGLARDARQLRAALIDFWRAFRSAAGGLPAVVPRIWMS